MIVNYWPQWFRHLYGTDWPDTYCCIDVETSGWSDDRDVITEWGHCLVVDGKIVDQLSLILDWTNHPVVPDNWLRTRMNGLRQGMEMRGCCCHITYDRMRDEGMKPKAAFEFIRAFTSKLFKQNIIAVLHGG